MSEHVNITWIHLVAITLGGGAGALMRFGGVTAMTALSGHTPLGTMMVNILGCLLIGIARAGVTNLQWWSVELRAMIFTGFLGSFTTFSTFEAETVTMWQQGQRTWAVLYCSMSVLLGLGAYILGWWGMLRISGS